MNLECILQLKRLSSWILKKVALLTLWLANSKHATERGECTITFIQCFVAVWGFVFLFLARVPSDHD